MIKKILIIWLFFVLQGFTNLWSLKSSNQKNSTIPDSAPYLGQTLPGETPVLFAPAILTSLSAFAGAPNFSPDGTQCFVSVGAADYATPATLYYSENTSGAWKPFSKASFLADFTSSCEPVFSADGHTVTFTGKKSASGSMDFWTVDYTAHGWGTPVCMPAPLNSGANEWRGSIMSDGTRYFGSERDQPGIYQVYKAYLDADRKPVVEKLGRPVNTNSYEGDPCIAADGHFLVFSSGRGGVSTDLFVSFSDGKSGWSTPINLGATFNTANDEYGAYLSHDGKYLFFTRHTSQGDGIYWVATSAIEKLKTDNQAGVTGPYFGQRFPGEIPEVFAPEFLSARYGFVARIAFSPDGTECFFTVTDATFSHPKILGSRINGDTWCEPAIPDFANPQWVNQEPFFSGDGTKLYFTSDRDVPPGTNKKDFWMVERTPKGWSEPKHLPPPFNSDYTEYFFSQAADGTAYFCSDRPKGIGALDLYRVRRVSGQLGRAENLGSAVNSKYYTGDPCIAPDGRFLVFAAARPEGRGGMDLYVSFSDGSNGWTVPVNLGDGFNTSANEYAPSLSPDERFLFFTRHDGKRADLHWVQTSTLERFHPDAPPPAKKSAEQLTAVFPQIKGAYFGLIVPGEKPEVFAPGIVSLDTRLETYPTFSPDGKAMFFSVLNAAWSEGKILWSRLENGAWTKPEAAPFSDERFINWESFISPDGKRMFFASNRPPSSGMDIWMVERMSDTSWSAPVRLPDSVNSAAEDGSPCLTNNSTLYFKSLRNGGIGGSWLYRAMFKDGAFTPIESLGAILKTTSGETEPYMSPDENFLIFISETRKGGNGGWDLWICFRNTDGSWTQPSTMGPEINTAADEYGPRVTPDGKYLFFTRETRGKTMDIYWVSASVIDRLRINASVK